MSDKLRVFDYIMDNVSDSEMDDAIDDAIYNYVYNDWNENGEYDSEWEWNEVGSDAVHDFVLEASYELKIALSNGDLAWTMDKVADEFDISIN